jgi:hypothetical protein
LAWFGTQAGGDFAPNNLLFPQKYLNITPSGLAGKNSDKIDQ